MARKAKRTKCPEILSDESSSDEDEKKNKEESSDEEDKESEEEVKCCVFVGVFSFLFMGEVNIPVMIDAATKQILETVYHVGCF